MTPENPTPELVIRRIQAWLEVAVIGLNLCPFAKPVWRQNRVRFVVSSASTEAALTADFLRELDHLRATPAQVTDTTILAHPFVLNDFFDYSAYLKTIDLELAIAGAVGEFQVASFHPDYQFAGTAQSAIENATNQAPYPCLHILREASLSAAIERYPDIEQIVLRNQDRMRALGRAGWEALFDNTRP